MFEIEYYIFENGECPAQEFIDSIKSGKLQAKVYRSLKLLETYGNYLTMPDSAYLEEGIYELRAIQGNDIVRCLYFFFIGKKIVITNGFVKKTQKTPRREIEIAKERRKDYERREKDRS